MLSCARRSRATSRVLCSPRPRRRADDGLGTSRDLLFSNPGASLPDIYLSESVKFAPEGTDFFYSVVLTHPPGMREDETVSPRSSLHAPRLRFTLPRQRRHSRVSFVSVSVFFVSFISPVAERALARTARCSPDPTRRACPRLPAVQAMNRGTRAVDARVVAREKVSSLLLSLMIKSLTRAQLRWRCSGQETRARAMMC